MASFQYGGLVEQIAVTATATGTTTLTNVSKQVQIFTGVLTQTVVLPVATTLQSPGVKFELINESTQSLTLQFQDTTAFTDAAGISYTTIYPHQSLVIKLQTNATANGTWLVIGNTSAGVNLIQPTIQKLLSGTGTYTTPAGVAYIEVEMVGGGGGGASLTGNTPGGGGSGSTGTYTGIVLVGTAGVMESGLPSNFSAGGTGGSSAFAGGGTGSFAGGGAGTWGGGGGGAGTVGANSSWIGGSGGGGAGYCEFTIGNPAVSYAWGAAGGGAGATGNQYNGAAGGAGLILIDEYYQ
jgi:hypothetical protein